MTTINKTRQAELTRELVRRITRSRHFDDRTSTYAPPARAIPRRIKKLLSEIEELRR